MSNLKDKIEGFAISVHEHEQTKNHEIRESIKFTRIENTEFGTSTDLERHYSTAIKSFLVLLYGTSKIDIAKVILGFDDYPEVACIKEVYFTFKDEEGQRIPIILTCSDTEFKFSHAEKWI